MGLVAEHAVEGIVSTLLSFDDAFLGPTNFIVIEFAGNLKASQDGHSISSP